MFNLKEVLLGFYCIFFTLNCFALCPAGTALSVEECLHNNTSCKACDGVVIGMKTCYKCSEYYTKECSSGVKQYRVSTADFCGYEMRECCGNDNSYTYWGKWVTGGSSCCNYGYILYNGMCKKNECTGSKPIASRMCGNCYIGKQSRDITCNYSNGRWEAGEWGSCEDSCVPGNRKRCRIPGSGSSWGLGNNGVQECGGDCKWGECKMENEFSSWDNNPCPSGWDCEWVVEAATTGNN